MAVLFVMPYQQFFDDDGAPLAGGFVYTYAAGSYSTPKAAYTTAAGDVELPNPIELDSAGRAVIFISGSYNYIVKDSAGVTIRSVPNVTSFNATTSTSEGFFQSFSGDASTTGFTTSDSLGSDEKALMIFSELEYSTNGTFASDTGWTKGAGWTIAAGVATATGAISTAIEQSAGITIIQGKSYLVKYTVTRSAGSITPNLGGTAGTARSASGTYSETIIADSTQTISFTTSGFTGTLDNVSVRDVGGLTIRNVSDYTISGTALSFAKAPASGTNNIFVFAPYTLINAAGAAQTAADAAQAAQAGAEAAVNAVAYQFTFDSSTSMADPGTGDFRLNNATLSSVTAIAVDALSSVAGNPDVSDGIAAWGGSGSTNKGQIKITKSGAPATFALYNITAAVTDNTGWLQITVTHVASNGTFSAADVCYLQNARTGDVGSQGPTGTVSGASSGTMVTNDKILFLDTSSADALTYDDPATIDLAIFGSGSATDGYVLTADGAGGAAFEALNIDISIVNNGRLTLTSGTPVTTTDVTGAGSVYFTPFKGNKIALYTGSAWEEKTFSEITISLASGYSSGKPYDVFAYNNAGTVALETLVWTDDTNRATALALQDGVYVKSGDATRKYIGTFYTASSTTTEDSEAKRYVWNYYNRVSRNLKKIDSTNSWSYSTASYRQANGSSANQIDAIVGVSEDKIQVRAQSICSNSTTTMNLVAVGIGLNGTTATANASQFYVNDAGRNAGHSFFDRISPVGRNYYTWLELGIGAGTQTWYGDNGAAIEQSGIFGTLLM